MVNGSGETKGTMSKACSQKPIYCPFCQHKDQEEVKERRQERRKEEREKEKKKKKRRRKEFSQKGRTR